MKPRIVLPIALVVLVVTVFFLDSARRQAQAEMKQMSAKLGQVPESDANSVENQKRAKEIVAKVKEHMEIDTTVEPTVATIVDVKKLQAQNAFYNKAKNGDFLIVTPSRAILYDAAADVIIDVVPVQIDQTPPSSQPSDKAAQ